MVRYKILRTKKNSERIEEFTEGNIFTVKKDTVHKMYNGTDSTAITFHVYSPPLKRCTNI